VDFPKILRASRYLQNRLQVPFLLFDFLQETISLPLNEGFGSKALDSDSRVLMNVQNKLR
jgi:hypothetical protein